MSVGVTDLVAYAFSHLALLPFAVCFLLSLLLWVLFVLENWDKDGMTATLMYWAHTLSVSALTWQLVKEFS